MSRSGRIPLLPLLPAGHARVAIMTTSLKSVQTGNSATTNSACTCQDLLAKSDKTKREFVFDRLSPDVRVGSCAERLTEAQPLVVRCVCLSAGSERASRACCAFDVGPVLCCSVPGGAWRPTLALRPAAMGKDPKETAGPWAKGGLCRLVGGWRLAPGRITPRGHRHFKAR